MTIDTVINAYHQLIHERPLVVNITNYVVMNSSANALLALGASPIMAHSQEEMAEIMPFAGALVINIGTLDNVWIPRMLHAVEQANINNKPVVLDPVGCGTSQLRTQTARDIARLADTLIIRGNASEIIALSGRSANSKGVDSRDDSASALDAAFTLVEVYQCNVVISGEIDYIVTPVGHLKLGNGSELMPLVTGTGCCLSALTGAFAAIGEMTGLAAAAVMGIAGEIATQRSAGPGSLQMNLIDALYQLDEETIRQRIHLL